MSEAAILEPGQTFKPFRMFKGALIPAGLLKGVVSRGAALLYGQLARYSGRDGLCFPGQDRVSREFGVTVRTIQRWLRELVKAGLIKAVRRAAGTRTNAYFFRWQPCLESSQLELPLEPMPPDLPPRIPPASEPCSASAVVEKAEGKKYGSRQNCRVNKTAFLTEEAQLALRLRENRGRDFGVDGCGKPEPLASSEETGPFKTAGEILQKMPGWLQPGACHPPEGENPLSDKAKSESPEQAWLFESPATQTQTLPEAHRPVSAPKPAIQAEKRIIKPRSVPIPPDRLRKAREFAERYWRRIRERPGAA